MASARPTAHGSAASPRRPGASDSPSMPGDDARQMPALPDAEFRLSLVGGLGDVVDGDVDAAQFDAGEPRDASVDRLAHGVGDHVDGGTEGDDESNGDAQAAGFGRVVGVRFG